MIYWQIFVLCISLLGCLTSSQPAVQASKKFSQSLNEFAVDLHKKLASKYKVTLCSPFGLATVLSTLLMGARGNTRQQILDVLHLSESTNPQVAKNFHQLIKQTQTNKYQNELELATSLWIDKKFDVFTNFTAILDSEFDAVEKSVALDTDNAIREMNGWLSKSTNGKIGPMFSGRADQFSGIVAASATSFHGTWLEEFTTTSVQNFTSYVNGKSSSVAMTFMELDTYLPYTESDELKAQVLELPYSGKELNMIIFLPIKPDGLQDLEAKLTCKRIYAAIRNLTTTHVVVQLPHLTMKIRQNFVPVFQSLGIQMTSGDWSGITQTKQAPVNQVIQLTDFTVSGKSLPYDEKNSPAVSYILQQVAPFFVTRPYMFLILDKVSEIILYIGRYT